MARTIKFTKEDILNKSVDFIKLYGYSKFTVRELAKFIGCSTQPIFKNYANMSEFRIDLKKILHNYYDKYINEIINKDDYLFSISYAYAKFASEESNIFKSLFMEDLAGSRTIDEVLSSSWNIDTIKSIPKEYSINYDNAKNLYRDVRFYTHGLACQLACKSIIVTDEEIKNLIKNIINNLKG